MKCVILAGGLGTRISEETVLKPKPMVEIGGKPILWHIMKIYSHYGINDFIICLGYKGYVVKEYFANYFLHTSDITIDIKNNKMDIHQVNAEPWKITLVDTGENTMTGGRLKRVKNHLEDTFCFTYGDGLSDVNISETIKFHKNNNKIGTLTAVRPPGKFGAVLLEEDRVSIFKEKSVESSWINGGFFVLEPQIIDYIESDMIPLEREPLEQLSKDRQLNAFKHFGFWQPMDTLNHKLKLDGLWKTNQAPWKVW